ncbi:hypothetical protein OF83DRAFT_1172519 [Amylostereum chailletii]|nr:hypothetical protein OF83DRAFT_1172519 [Amylostereum chailletii]
MDLIQQIRFEHGFDHSVPRSQNDPLLHLRGKLERAVERLSYDLYNKKTHFLLEFIQNADDNLYGHGVVPTLELYMQDRQMTVRCNELGFTAENVRAICDIGGSTKTGGNTQGFIGEKGIGFKSVFTIADVVHVESGPYQFKFDRNLPLGMITPIVLPTQTQASGWTTFRLHLAPSEDESLLVSQLYKVRPTLLLFLRKLRHMSITLFSPIKPRILMLRRFDEDGNKVRLDRVDNGDVTSQLYLIYKQWISMPSGQAKREGIDKSEVVLAFPIAADEQPVIAMQEIHAFLPLRCYGFSFVIQADFLTSASRDDVLVDLEWNLALRSGITTSFLSAVYHFLSHPTLRLTWFRFLPQNINDYFFASVEHDLIDRIQSCLCLLNSSGVPHPPRHLVIHPLRFSDEFKCPLIPEKYLPYGLEYVSHEYDLEKDAQILHRIGVLDLSNDLFLTALVNFVQSGQFVQQPDLWHDAVASCLLELWNAGLGYRTAIKHLKIIPLSDGKWENALGTSGFTFGLEDREIPDELGIRTVKSGIPKLSSRYHLYTVLGVQEASPNWIANKILTSKGPKQFRSLIQYARFFFDHRHFSGFPKPLQLKFAGEDGRRGQADELYVDVPLTLDGEENDLHEILPSSAPFIHPEYLIAYEGLLRDEWVQWLCSVVGLNKTPRILRGLPSPELLDMSTHLSTPLFLVVLRHFWPSLQSKLTAGGCRQLSEVSITCEDGVKRTLKSTHLKRGSLLQYADLPFLPVTDPAAHHWDFLGDLGVGLRLDVGSMLSILTHMQSSSGMTDRDAVQTIYDYLDAEFPRHGNSIKTAFCNLPIILIPGEKERKDLWLRPFDVYWKGSRSIRTKPVLSRIYPSLRDFFSVKLGVVDAPPFAIVDEAVTLASSYGGKIISTVVQERAAGILVDLSEVLTLSKEPPASFRMLSDHAIFPVRFPDSGLKLCTAEEFYVPDTSGKYAEMFGSKVPMLAMPSSLSISLLQHLFDLDVFDRKMRHLQTLVLRRSITRGIRRPDTDTTRRYASRIGYIARMICHKQRGVLTDDQIIYLTRVQNITFFNVDSINATISLDAYIFTSEEGIAFEEDKTSSGIIVLVSQQRSSKKPVDLEVCDHSARVLDTDVLNVFTCVSQEEKMLDQLLRFAGIKQLSKQIKEALFTPAVVAPVTRISQEVGSVLPPVTPAPVVAAIVSAPHTASMKPQSESYSIEPAHTQYMTTTKPENEVQLPCSPSSTMSNTASRPDSGISLLARPPGSAVMAPPYSASVQDFAADWRVNQTLPRRPPLLTVPNLIPEPLQIPARLALEPQARGTSERGLSITTPPHASPHSSTSNNISPEISSPLYEHPNKRRLHTRNIPDSKADLRASENILVHAQGTSADEVTLTPQGGWIHNTSTRTSQANIGS